MKLPAVPKQYEPAYFERLLAQLGTEIEALKKADKTTKVPSVSQNSNQSLESNKLYYALDGDQNFELILKAEDGRVYRISGRASASSSALASPQTYTVTNGTLDRTFDASASSTNELANLIYTLLSDLKALGFVKV